jgi:hypothetical protein
MKYISIFLLTSATFVHCWAQQKDTLRNFPKDTPLYAPKYSGNNQWGYYLGQNQLYRQQYAEKYHIQGKAKVTGIVTHLVGKFANAGNAVEFNVYSVGTNKLPDIRLSTFSITYPNLDLSGKAFSVEFPNPVAVSDSFFVTFNVDDYMHGGFDGDTLGLYCGENGSRPRNDLKNFGRNAVQIHNHDIEEWKDFYSQNFSPIATHFALFPIVEMAEPTGIDDLEEEKALAISVSPNPASGSFRVNFHTKESSNVQLSIKALDGREVYKRNLGMLPAGEHSQVVEKLELEYGCYIVDVRFGLYSTFSRIIIQ